MRMRVLVVLCAAAFVPVGCGQNAAPLTDNAAPPADQNRVQGVWKLEASVTDNGFRKAQEGNTARLQIAGNVVTLRGSATDAGEAFTASWDEHASPKVLTLVPLDADGHPRPGDTRRWIYDLDGNTLTVAYGYASSPPPEFKPDPSNGVIVLRYQKTDETPSTHR